MGGSMIQIAMVLLGAGVAGVVGGWLLRAKFSTSASAKPGNADTSSGLRLKYKKAIRERDQFATDYAKLRTSMEPQLATLADSRTKLEDMHQKAQILAKSVLTLRAERENTKLTVTTIQNALMSVKQTTSTLQAEFVKSGDFYKGELLKSFEKRKALEVKLEAARSEKESVSNLLQSSRSEHDSINQALDSAQVQLLQLGVLERNTEKLEQENAKLSEVAAKANQELEEMRRDIEEIDALKIHNQELTRALEGMDSSRRQSEDEAEQMRDQADESEKQSDTLRLKLDDLQKNFAEIEAQQSEAIKDARQSKVVPISGAPPPNSEDMDDLKQIIGVGKAFEQTLHELGIYTFQQIAAFDLGDIARVNAELKEFKGRMEQDDWIGQAKDLHFKKYGQTA
jgi:predicted flap endonuclease-1-like 5' DNA nuclease